MMLGDDMYVYMCVKFDIMNINEVGGLSVILLL